MEWPHSITGHHFSLTILAQIDALTFAITSATAPNLSCLLIITDYCISNFEKIIL